MPLSEAREIAKRSLLANIRRVDEGEVLTAGSRQFRSVWARDFCFSTGGLVAAGRADAARSTLRALLTRQRADGLLPRLLDTGSWVLRVIVGAMGGELALEGRLKPNYVGEHFAAAIDGNALACWSAEQCADEAFAREFLPALEKALAYYDGHLVEGLISQAPFSDWQDSIRSRRGRVFFTNLLYWRAHLALAAVAERAGRDGAPWRGRADALKRRVHDFFWEERAGAYRNLETGGPLSADGMLFAALWGFGDPARLMRALQEAGIFMPWGPRCAIPDYSFFGRGFITRAAGIADYHDRMIWLWQSGLAVRAWRAAGEPVEADKLAAAIAEILERDGAAGEVYEPEDGRLVRRPFYRSETPFSWGSAMVLEALSECYP